MIQELVEFGRRKTKVENIAFVEDDFSAVIVINSKGEFLEFKEISGTIETAIITEHNEKNKNKKPVGAICGKKGHVRFLLDKSAEILGVDENNKIQEKKHDDFMKMLERYKDVQVLQPIFLFYDKKNKEGLAKAVSIFQNLKSNYKKDNFTFMLNSELLLKNDEVKFAIKNLYDKDVARLIDGKICSVCGKSDSPVLDEPQGLVKMPKGQTAGCALVSYNASAYESYGLEGNLNSSICRECARYYIEGLHFLLSNGHNVEYVDKQKPYFRYNHRINISDNTVALFWTREDTDVIDPFLAFDSPNVAEIKNLFDSVWKGKRDVGSVVDTNMFYTCTLSSAAARIAVRDWTAICLNEYKMNLAEWFHDIEMVNNIGEITYTPLKLLINASQRDKKTGEKPKADLYSKARIGAILWNASIKGHSYEIPLEVLQYVLNRIWKKDRFSLERAALIKLVINRNTNKNMKSTLDESYTSVAYLCGRLFAIIEAMQWKAIGNVNSGVKERYFAATATQPFILGTLLTKNVPIYQHKIGGYLAKELNEITGRISEVGSFPKRFTTIEQGEFALGYYFQINHKKDNEKKENIN